jgi:hypothetical protein
MLLGNAFFQRLAVTERLFSVLSMILLNPN